MTPGFFKKIFAAFFALIVSVLFSVGYVYASENTPTPGGEGLGAISGYVIENVTYNLGNDPSKIASVSFTLSAEAAWVKIQLTDAQSDWYNCMHNEAKQWTCDTNNATLSSVNQLRVSASGN